MVDFVRHVISDLHIIQVHTVRRQNLRFQFVIFSFRSHIIIEISPTQTQLAWEFYLSVVLNDCPWYSFIFFKKKKKIQLCERMAIT